jgi:hypothetical protein
MVTVGISTNDRVAQANSLSPAKGPAIPKKVRMEADVYLKFVPLMAAIMIGGCATAPTTFSPRGAPQVETNSPSC